LVKKKKRHIRQDREKEKKRAGERQLGLKTSLFMAVYSKWASTSQLTTGPIGMLCLCGQRSLLRNCPPASQFM